MPVQIRTYPDRNLLYVYLDGYLGDDEVVAAVDRVIAEIGRLDPGFDAITDIRHFKPGSPKVAEELMRAQRAYKARSVRRLIRIVGESVVAKMQFQRTGKEIGLEMT